MSDTNSEFDGNTLSLKALDDGFFELCFNAKHGSINKLSTETIEEFIAALDSLEQHREVRGLLISSAKPVFIVGADITEFGANFSSPKAEQVKRSIKVNNTFTRLEQFPFPVVVAINGAAMGGGLELCLACDYRIMSATAKIGLPEVKLGIIPGWGGTVRLPRLIGLDNAMEWIASGAHQRADKALGDGVVDAVVAPDILRAEAEKLLSRCAAGDLNYQARRPQKHQPLVLNAIELQMAASTGKAVVMAQAGKHFPAPVLAVDVMIQGATLGLDDALAIEREGLINAAQTPQCDALVGLFLNDQYIDKIAKTKAKESGRKVARAAVLGAGIMGGGIAHQNVSKGIPVMMKDINQDALQLGLNEANKLLSKKVSRGRMTALAAGETLSKIDATLSYDGIQNCDVVVEAVVENPKIKMSVLAEVEGLLSDDAILASNTSTISITALAKALKRPEQFCGMHFFNPVHAMPLVEIIRGEKTSEETISTMVGYALALGKKPIVVNDCPGFLVNRVLFPYFNGFDQLLRDGADFRQVDKVMESWGWPMGPGYLLDVVGIDTGVHGAGVMAEGFPDRMAPDYKTITQTLFENQRLGQKNKTGFYRYELDKKGKPKKVFDEEVYDLFPGGLGSRKEFDKDDIVARMMIPMCIELARCLEDGIVASPAEADMGLITGIGFPTFRGGVFRWLDQTGLQTFCDLADAYQHLGKLYEPTQGMRELAKAGRGYYS